MAQMIPNTLEDNGISYVEPFLEFVGKVVHGNLILK